MGCNNKSNPPFVLVLDLSPDGRLENNYKTGRKVRRWYIEHIYKEVSCIIHSSQSGYLRFTEVCGFARFLLSLMNFYFYCFWSVLLNSIFIGVQGEFLLPFYGN